jgi:hypothetical protein
MSWGQWMVVEFSVEEELRIERQARTVLHCGDSVEVAKLCASLVKQNAYLSQLVRQATGHITQLELMQALDEIDNPDPERSEAVRLLCESGNWDLTDQDDTQDRSLFVTLLLIALTPFLWLIGAFAGLLAIAMRTMNRVIRSLVS